MRDLVQVEEETRVVLNSMMQGWGKPWIMDNIKIELDEDEEDFYDSAVVVRKRINKKWEIMDTFFFRRYIEDGCMLYDKMSGDIVKCVQEHHENPKKKSFDDGGKWIDDLLESPEWDRQFQKLIDDGLYQYERND